MTKIALRLAAVAMLVLAVLWMVPAPTATGQMKKYRVGLVFDVGGRGDLSFNDMAYAGLARAAKQFGAGDGVSCRMNTGEGSHVRFRPVRMAPRSGRPGGRVAIHGRSRSAGPCRACA